MSMFQYTTLAQDRTLRALDYLRRADHYRARGNEQNARGCERKALKKFEQSFQMRHWPLRSHGPGLVLDERANG